MLKNFLNKLKNKKTLGHLDGLVVKHLTLAQVMISWLVGLSPTLGEFYLSVSVFPCAPHLFAPSLSLPLKKTKTTTNNFRGAWVAQLVKHLTLGFG